MCKCFRNRSIGLHKEHFYNHKDVPITKKIIHVKIHHNIPPSNTVFVNEHVLWHSIFYSMVQPQVTDHQGFFRDKFNLLASRSWFPQSQFHSLLHFLLGGTFPTASVIYWNTIRSYAQITWNLLKLSELGLNLLEICLTMSHIFQCGSESFWDDWKAPPAFLTGVSADLLTCLMVFHWSLLWIMRSVRVVKSFLDFLCSTTKCYVNCFRLYFLSIRTLLFRLEYSTCSIFFLGLIAFHSLLHCIICLVSP